MGSNSNQKEHKYFSELIGDSYKEWENTRIILEGGTGTGKTYFIINILGVYAQETGKSILYLCNRSGLKNQTYDEIKKLGLRNTIYVTTYQSLQSRITRKEEIKKYDYVIVDEAHYFKDDALFNEYTDLAQQFIETQTDNVVVYISATCRAYFYKMIKDETVLQNHYFIIPKSYDYVESVYFYEKKQLIPKVDYILENEQDSKIIIFCNSISRMLELYKKYDDEASYLASKSAKKVSAICDERCIYEHDDGRVTFDKRILITTKVIDNGVNIKDTLVKHIFSEILDVDSAIQALGRKRKTSEDDTCTFYIKQYSGQAIQAMINSNEFQTNPVLLYQSDYNRFVEEYGANRERIRNNKIFYMAFDKQMDKNKLSVNKTRLEKYLLDISTLNDMKELGYQEIMLKLLGDELSSKSKILELQVEEKDEFIEYMKSIEGKWLYADDRKYLTKKFEAIGIKMRTPGINALNGALQDAYKEKYKCRFRNKQLDENGEPTKKNLVDKRRKLEDGSINMSRNKTYWILE